MAKVKMRELLPVVAEYYNVTVQDMMGHSRQVKYAKPRMVFYWMCRLKLEKTFPEIGRFMNRDHTTILYGARRCREEKWLSLEDADELFEKVGKGESR